MKRGLLGEEQGLAGTGYGGSKFRETVTDRLGRARLLPYDFFPSPFTHHTHAPSQAFPLYGNLTLATAQDQRMFYFVLVFDFE